MQLPPIPPVKLVRLVRLFQLSLGIFLLLSTLLLNGCSSHSADVGLTWLPSSTIPKTLLQAAVTENTTLSADKSTQITVATVPTKQKNQQLYIFNYNTAETCGRLGCLYVAYLADKNQKRYKQVLSVYLHPDLPAEHPLFSLSPQTQGQTLPCLEVKQVSKKDTLTHLTYCFNDSSYQPTQTADIQLSNYEQ